MWDWRGAMIWEAREAGTDLHEVLIVFVGRELPGESDGLVAAQHSGGEVDHQRGL